MKGVYHHTDEEMRQMYKDGKLTPHGREMAKLLDRALPAEKVNEWVEDEERV